jgi:hypothetical protein
LVKSNWVPGALTTTDQLLVIVWSNGCEPESDEPNDGSLWTTEPLTVTTIELVAWLL